VTSSDPFGLVGQVLDGQFRVDRPVGEGGFSVVYRGTHIGLTEPIAVKCLKLPAALGSMLVESFVKRFRDESRLHYKLSQGNLHIVRSIASGTTIAPSTSALVPYTVLEWLDGRSLAQDFADRREAGMRGRPLRDVVSLLDSAIDALAYAHSQGVVHRDLNPGNLFLARTQSGTKVKVLDFGVAKIMADAAIAMGPTARTVGNLRMFAPAYGAPEQFDDRLGAIGPWTDVYAIGLVILEALADRTVMEGEHLGEFATKALDATRRPTPRAFGIAVGDETEKVLAFALSLDPRRRPRDVGELWGMLKHAIQVDERSGRPPHAEPPAENSPATLRMDERADRASRSPQDAPGAGPGGPGTRAFGGTMRMDTGAARLPRSATEVLASTPNRARASVAPPPPQGPQARAPARPSSPDDAEFAVIPGSATHTPLPASSIDPGTPASRSRSAAVLLLALVMVAVLGTAVVFGRRAWNARATVPAAPAGHT
jgi:serine/threonine protein kinase